MTNKDTINKLKDMADCADASYAMLHYVNGFMKYNKWFEQDDIEWGDNQTLGDKFEIRQVNSTYARCIQARFEKDCCVSKFSFTNESKNFHSTKNHSDSQVLDNNPLMVAPTDLLSLRTRNFTNRYELLKHQENTLSGFSATLFYDTQNQEYIVAFRGTEGFFKGKYCA